MGLQEGEVIQHSMITKSIERAQKKVEENNFSTRKRLLEYDDVMNSQREVIYKRRKNALAGERLQLDIMNMLYDICEDIILTTHATSSYDNFKLNFISKLGFNPSVTEEEFRDGKPQDLANKVYHEAYDYYNKKNKQIAEKALPVFKDIFRSRGATVETVLVPFTDGKRQISVTADLKKVVENNSNELIKALEKYASLAMIDTVWKEHLRDMDDLKQSVQNAVFEQKDPLLIYKFEGFELFKALIAKVNEETMSFLFKADLPVSKPEEVREAKEPVKTKQHLKEKKEEAHSVLGNGSFPGNGGGRMPEERMDPIKAEKIAGRNDRVSVQYLDGSVKKDVKFKTVEEDVKNNKCVII
jgi:preprotein translocase subunit SecA